MLKKTVAIITLHRVYNYGSALQAYATGKVFEKHSCKPIIIDYRRHQDQLKNRIFSTDWKNSKSVPEYIKKSVYYVLRFVSIIIKEATIGRFVRCHLNLTKIYNSPESLKKNPPVADIYVTGSDQTWNSKYNNGIDPAFFLDFVDNAPKIAFAASIGKTSFDDEESRITAQYLREYNAISVREKSAKSLLNSLGFAEVVNIIDPTMQLSKEEWASISTKRLVKNKYLLLMLLYNEDNNATKIAREIANRKGLELVKISWEVRKPNEVDTLMTHRTPEDFISLFYYADFIVTNSFHGLCFAINFEKQFVAIKRNEFNSRLDGLLELFDLTDRMVTFENYDAIINESIDYASVTNKLEEERRTADMFLQEALQ